MIAKDPHEGHSNLATPPDAANRASGPRLNRWFVSPWHYLAGHIVRWWPLYGLLVVSTLVFGWFHGFHLKSFWDVTAPYDPPYGLFLGTQAWYPFLNYGSPNFVQNGIPILLLYDATYRVSAGSTVISEQLAWWLLFLYGEVSAFTLFRHYFGRTQTAGVAAFTAAILYSFNPYAAFTSWGDSAPYSPLVLGTLPLAILLVERYFSMPLARDRVVLAMLLGLVSPLLFAFFPLLIPCLAILAAVFFSHLRDTRKLAGLVALTIPVALALNAYWWVPDYVLNSSALLPINSVGSANATVAGVVFFSQFTPLSLSVRLLGENSLNAGWWTFASQFIWGSGGIVLLLLVLPLVAFMGLILAPRTRRAKALLYATIGLIGMILATGAGPQSPTAGFYLWMIQNVPTARTVNYPAVSWIPLILLSYCYLTGSLILDASHWSSNEGQPKAASPSKRLTAYTRARQNVKSRSGAISIGVLVVAVALLSGFPLVTGQVSNNTFGSDFTLPSGVTELSQFLNDHSAGFKTLLLPPSINGLYAFSWGNGFLAYDPLDSLTSVNLIGNYNPGQSLQDALYEIPGVGLPQRSFNSSRLSESAYDVVLAENSVKYVVVREDARNTFPYAVNFSANATIQFLDNNSNLTFSGSFGSDMLYEVRMPQTILQSHPNTIPNMLLSENFLPQYVDSIVSFSSPFPNAYGSVSLTSGALTLSGLLNKSVPWAIFSNHEPLNLHIVGAPALVVVSNGSSRQIIPVINNGTDNFFVGATANLIVGTTNVTFIALPAIDRIQSLLFTTINSTVGISGMFLMYNLSVPQNLGNLSTILPGSLSTNGSSPAILQTNLAVVAAQAAASAGALDLKNSASALGARSTNITSDYIRAGLSFNGSSPASLNVTNGTIHLQIVNSQPFDLLINNDSLGLPVSAGDSFVLLTTEPVGVLLYNRSTPIDPLFTGQLSLRLPSGLLLEVVDEPTSLNVVNFIGIQTQPYDAVTVLAIAKVNGSSVFFPSLNVTTDAVETAVVTNLTVAPVSVKGAIRFPVAGDYALSLSQVMTPAWRFGLTQCESSNKSHPAISPLSLEDSIQGYFVSVTTATACNFEFEFQPQSLASAASIASEISVALVGGAALIIMVYRKQRR
jgi:hypothetical protein